MLYTILEISNLLDLSKVTIYKRLKLKELEPHKSKKHGITYVTEEGFNLIKNFKPDINDSNDSNSSKKNSGSNSSNDYTATDLDDLSLNKDMIKTLINQLKANNLQLSEKDIQLSKKDAQIDKLHNLIENSQVLLKEKPQQDVLLLEEHFQDLDNKLIEIKDKMQKKDQDHKGLFQKLFKK